MDNKLYDNPVYNSVRPRLIRGLAALLFLFLGALSHSLPYYDIILTDTDPSLLPSLFEGTDAKKYTA